MTELIYSQADNDFLPDPFQGQPERSVLLDEKLINLSARYQEILEIQPFRDSFFSVSEKEHPIIESVYKTDCSTITKRKRNVEPQNLARTKVRESADEPVIMGDNSLLAVQLKVAEQEKGKKILIVTLKAREDTIIDRDDGMESDIEGMEKIA